MRKLGRQPVARTERRRAAWARGRAAERAVAEYLTARDFVVLGTNVRVGPFELDVVARDHDTIVVVEVRTRGAGAWEGAFASMGPRKRQRVRAGGERLWRERYGGDPSLQRMRFDAASVSFGSSGEPCVEYAVGAF